MPNFIPICPSFNLPNLLPVVVAMKIRTPSGLQSICQISSGLVHKLAFGMKEEKVHIDVALMKQHFITTPTHAQSAHPVS